jgi:EAL domain-containing protein (putative c-di-GMP-specific phosphodiesterase class I)
MAAPELLLPGTAETVRLELMRHQLPPRALTIEITEGAFMVDLDRAAAALEEMRALGVCISLDDFGTAYSSLSWLRRLPIDKLKVDRSYVSGIESEPEDLSIVRCIIDLARAFHHDVVAEGVETAGQLRVLRELGVNHAQGYFFARPMPAEQISAAGLQALAKL